MNLAQCIPAEFVWDSCKPRHAPVRPNELPPPLGLVWRTSNELEGAAHEPVRTNRDRLTEARARPARRRGGDPVSDSNPWPRGKRGLRLLLLRLIAGSRKPPLSLRDLTARVGMLSKEPGVGELKATSSKIQMTLRFMTRLKHVERSGADKHYRYAITAAGRAALDWEG